VFQRKDIASGFFLLFLGLYVSFHSTRFSVWGRTGPEAGFYPFVLGILMIGMSLLLIIRAFISTRAEEKLKSAIDKEKHMAVVFKVCSYIVLMALYGLLVQKVGFLVSSIVVLIIILKFLEKLSWKKACTIGFSSILVSYMLFVYFLSVPLPKGFIGF